MNEKEPNNLNIYSNKSSSSNLNSNNNKIDKSLLEEQLKCSICKNIYDSEIHFPFVIKCGHTFCKQCILNNQNNNCPIDNFINPFELYIKNLKLESIINKFFYNYNNKSTPSQKQMIYIKPDIKRNKYSNFEREDENINININNDIPNKARGKSNNQRLRNSDYKIYDNNNNFKNSPIYKDNSKKSSQNNIIPKNVNMNN